MVQLREISRIDRDLSLGVTGDDVALVQEYLVNFGFLVGSFDGGNFDKATEDAVRAFRVREGLSDARDVDLYVRKRMSIPRCSMLGISVIRDAKLAPSSCGWPKLEEPIPYGAEPELRELTKICFGKWGEILKGMPQAPSFEFTEKYKDATIWASWESATDSYFQNEAWGHSDFPPECPDANESFGMKPVHLNQEYLAHWDRRSVQAALLHEIGHLHGLYDSSDTKVIMSDILGGVWDITTDDENLLINIYK